MTLTNFHYRDYLDLGQNKGLFSTPDKSVTIRMKNGENFKFDRIPNNFARTNYGSFTSLGRNYVVTASHIQKGFISNDYNPSKTDVGRTSFNQTRYTFLTGNFSTQNTIAEYAKETMYLKTSKYIVEGEISPVEIDGLKPSSQINNSDVGKEMHDVIS